MLHNPIAPILTTFSKWLLCLGLTTAALLPQAWAECDSGGDPGSGCTVTVTGSSGGSGSGLLGGSGAGGQPRFLPGRPERADPVEIALEQNINRYEAGCRREEEQKEILNAAIATPQVQTGQAEPPDTKIGVPMTDARYPAEAGWEKRTFFRRITVLILGGGKQTGQIEIHYAWNSRTRQAADLKFKNTVAQGCIGQAPATGVAP